VRPGGKFGVLIVVVTISLLAAVPVRAASIFGTVTDAVTHAGIASFEVCAYKAWASQAEAELMPESKFCTPAEAEPETPGEYTLGGIPMGQYKVAFLPAAGSNYASEFYDDVRTWEEAEALDVPTGTPIDAALDEVPPGEEPAAPSGEPAPPPAVVAPALVASPVPGTTKPAPIRCRRGFKKRKVRGKVRCVRVRRSRRRQHVRSFSRSRALSISPACSCPWREPWRNRSQR
jgi:hypothetical protein